MDRFGKIEKIAEGGFGVVYKAIDTETGKPCALKRMKEIDQSALDEVEALQEVKGHPNVITILTYFISRGSLWVVTEFCELGDLNRYFVDKQPDFNVRFRFMKQMSSAVSFLHNRGIAHRDLKPENVLIGLDADSHPLAQLTDFGLAKIHCGEQMTRQFMTTCAGTAFFLAPEVLVSQFGGIYTIKADIFSLGVIFRALVFERVLQCGDNSKYLVACFIIDGQAVPYSRALVTDKNLQLMITKDLLASSTARKIMDGMVHRNPDERLSAKAVHDALSHLKAEDFRAVTAASSQQSSAACFSSESTTTVKPAGAQLLSRFSTAVRSVKPQPHQSEARSAATQILYDILTSQFSQEELMIVKSHFLVQYLMIATNAPLTYKVQLKKWADPVIEGFAKMQRGEKLNTTEMARFAFGWLKFSVA